MGAFRHPCWVRYGGLIANQNSPCTETCSKTHCLGEMASGLQSPRQRDFQNSGRYGHRTRLSVYCPGGGLHAKSGYQQEVGSSVLFEHCSAHRALAVEKVDELTSQIRMRCVKMHEVRVHRRLYLQEWRQCIDRAQTINTKVSTLMEARFPCSVVTPTLADAEGTGAVLSPNAWTATAQCTSRHAAQTQAPWELRWAKNAGVMDHLESYW